MFIYKESKIFNNIYEIITYEHISGAKHFHVNDLINNETLEKSFIVSFETLPSSNNGIAHVLEHLILTGSKKYQGISPFFAMTRRSLANYMNALTYSDKTLYAYSTIEENDFNNLLDFYLDSVFFPNLNELDFKQEAWHYNLDKNKVSVQGVVYNEMQGSIADRSYFVLNQIEKMMKPNTTYEYISGGDPLNITDLTYQEVIDFYHQFYNPNKAIYLTFGNINLSSFHEKIHSTVYLENKSCNEVLTVENSSQQQVNITSKSIVVNPSTENAKKSDYFYMLCWKLKEPSSDLVVDMSVLWKLLFEQGSVVANQIENLHIGSLSGYNGIHQSKNSLMIFGLEHLTEKQAKTIEQKLVKLLSNININQEDIDEVINSIELDWSIPANGIAGGIDFLMEYLVDNVTYNKQFNNSFNLNNLRNKFTVEYVKELINKLSLEIPKVEITGIPDVNYYKNRKQKEIDFLNKINQELTLKDKSNLVEEKEKLDYWIENKEKNTKLPIFNISNIAKKRKDIGEINKISDGLYISEIQTNNLNYVNISFDLSNFTIHELQKLGLICDIVESLATHDMNWEKAVLYRKKLVKNSYIELVPYTDKEDKTKGMMMLDFSNIILCKNIKNLERFYQSLWKDVVFQDANRMALLLENIVKDFEVNLESNAFSLVDLKNKSNLNFNSFISHKIDGLDYLSFIQKSLYDLENNPKEFIQELEIVWNKLFMQKSLIVFAGNKDNVTELKQIQNNFNLIKNENFKFENSKIKVEKIQWIDEYTAIDHNVNYCYQIYETINFNNPDSIYLKLIGEIITHYYLLPLVREKGGAYDCSVSYDTMNGLFQLSSYSDPNFEKTLKVFSDALNWFEKFHVEDNILLEAKIVILQEIEKDMNPTEKIIVSKFLKLVNKTNEDREKLREKVLNATSDNIKQVFHQYLKNLSPKKFAIIKKSNEKIAKKLDFTKSNLLDF